MTYYQCPSCQQPTIPFWTKQFLGPGRTITCPGCGASLSVPLSSMWVITPVRWVMSGVAGAVLAVLGARQIKNEEGLRDRVTPLLGLEYSF